MEGDLSRMLLRGKGTALSSAFAAKTEYSTDLGCVSWKVPSSAGVQDKIQTLIPLCFISLVFHHSALGHCARDGLGGALNV